MTTIELRPASKYDREHYGLLFESATLHTVHGRIHNPTFPHRVQVWVNRNGKTPDGEYGPDQTLTFLLTAEPVMIASTPIDRSPRGDTLAIDETIELTGFGTFQIRSRALADPILIHKPASASPR